MRMFRLAIAITSVVSLTACAGNTTIPGPNPSAKPGLLSAGVSPSSETPKESRFNPFRDESETSSHSQRQVITNPTNAQVMLPGPLSEMAVGRVDAPVTIIKYASLTCPYCRIFQLETFPELKREYIDTGKVRFILREFPIGFQSGAATIALRCAPAASYFPLYTDLLRHQRVWVSQEVRHDPIFSIAKKHGISRPEFDACVKDEVLVQNLKWVKDRGRTLGVIGTPNFFVNGKLYKRVLTMKDFHKLISDELANQVASTKKP
jgi:protein-disulfide isomerase